MLLDTIALKTLPFLPLEVHWWQFWALLHEVVPCRRIMGMFKLF